MYEIETTFFIKSKTATHCSVWRPLLPFGLCDRILVELRWCGGDGVEKCGQLSSYIRKEFTKLKLKIGKILSAARLTGELTAQIEWMEENRTSIRALFAPRVSRLCFFLFSHVFFYFHRFLVNSSICLATIDNETRRHSEKRRHVFRIRVKSGTVKIENISYFGARGRATCRLY